jgi:hypothetical protein
MAGPIAPPLAHSSWAPPSAIKNLVEQKKNKVKTDLYENNLNKNIGKVFGQTNIRIKSFVETLKSKF